MNAEKNITTDAAGRILPPSPPTWADRWGRQRATCEEACALLVDIWQLYVPMMESHAKAREAGAELRVTKEEALRIMTGLLLLLRGLRVAYKSLADTALIVIPELPIPREPSWDFPPGGSLRTAVRSPLFDQWVEFFVDGVDESFKELQRAILTVRPEWRFRRGWRSFFKALDKPMPFDAELPRRLGRFLDLLEKELRAQESHGRGRPPEWDASAVRTLIYDAGIELKARTGRVPKLREVAEEINRKRPMTTAALKMLVKRYGIRWRQLVT